MNRIIPIAALPLVLASCGPAQSPAEDLAKAACQRADVQDVVSKEARSIMIKNNMDHVFTAALFGIDIPAGLAQAHIAFGAAGVSDSVAAKGPPYRQIVCSGSMQVDLSNSTEGQNIVESPHLRWSINFAKPTDDPANDVFTVQVDPLSIYDGQLLNGRPMPTKEPPAPTAEEQAPDQGRQQPAANELSEAQRAAEEAHNAAGEAAEAARQAQAEAEQAQRETAPAPRSQTNREPSDEELYAPH